MDEIEEEKHHGARDQQDPEASRAPKVCQTPVQTRSSWEPLLGPQLRSAGPLPSPTKSSTTNPTKQPKKPRKGKSTAPEPLTIPPQATTAAPESGMVDFESESQR
mmetsp:Transcript_26018/g.19596  ORF Transcript_26018/g.19596 Transcript_26018/m.19596 type:complete len:105 (-) Transcript_26018:122-436(-)|eukprot:CAMPEP_0202971178 /NCGR_PEP_ID=MMETSP1396-20130829/24810_1 /ASSEMBLY_ACC=CAM_ASM_000872 /TAXON_ID= /ORGANISM="Pseudokeronopsis sp., Strain Brazil" /LENGTH=104 /DNA_ID=CAMNT_0049700307 /DNA_START=282 /DNA_END=596 /DNA_ORIENTATION=-